MAGLGFLAGQAAALLPSREQMAFTLAYHILLVPLGVVFPLITIVMEGIGLRRKDDVALELARRWSVAMAIQFAIGAVTGTVLSFEFGLLWPRMMGRFGDVFGQGFAIEGWAFFIEAIFIGIYLYGWKRLPPKVHFRLGWVLPPTGFLGAFGVIAANSWMNTPAGFTLGPGGRPENVDVLAALFTRALGYEYWHFMVGMYITAGFMVASVYAVGWLRGRRDRYHRLGFVVPFTIAAVLTPIQFVIGDLATRALTADQPAKYAAMEVTWRTRGHNPEVVGGLMLPGGVVRYGIVIPDGNSLLAGYSPDAVVPGLTSVPADARPNLVEVNITHLAFDLMVGLGGIGILLTLWYAVAWIRRRDLPRSLWFFRAAALAGVGSYLAVESGWFVTEVGRQPWIVYNVMRVADSVNPVDPTYVWIMFGVLVVVYSVIAFVFVTVMLRLSASWRRQREAPELGAPYGPRPETFDGGSASGGGAS